MQILARPSLTSTCPLCRAQVLRSLGLECSTCHAIAHAGCVKEIGGCHANGFHHDAQPSLPPRRHTGPVGWDPDWREQMDRPRAPTPSPPLTLADRIEGFALLAAFIGLPLGAVLAFMKAGVSGACGFAFYAGVGYFSVHQGLRGILRGEVETTARGSSERYTLKEQPLSYLFHLAGWLLMGLAPICVGIALLVNA